MTVYINGTPTQTLLGASIAHLLQSADLSIGTRAAIAVDGQVVRRGEYETFILTEGAEILIINPTFGG